MAADTNRLPTTVGRNTSLAVSIRHYVLLLVLFACSNAIAYGQSVDALVDRFISAKGPDTAGTACRELFESDLSYTDSQKLNVNSESHAIALQSAWRLHHRVLPPKEATFGAYPEVSHVPDIQRFVGFVEGRLRTQAPLWWEDMLACPDKLHPSRTGERTQKWLRFPTVDPTSDVQMIKLPAVPDHVILPTETMLWLTEESGGHEYTLALQDDMVVIVSKPTAICGSRLTCVESKTGKGKWRKDIWGTNQHRMARSGPECIPVDVVSFKLTNETLTIFGARSFRIVYSTHHSFISSAFYIEQYSLNNGDCIVRFSTNNWGVTQ